MKFTSGITRPDKNEEREEGEGSEGRGEGGTQCRTTGLYLEAGWKGGGEKRG